MINNMINVSPLVFLLVVFGAGVFGYYKGYNNRSYSRSVPINRKYK